MKLKTYHKRKMICPVCRIEFMGSNNSKTCGATPCGKAFRSQKGYVTAYHKRMNVKTFKLRNGLEVLNNAFGKELAGVN